MQVKRIGKGHTILRSPRPIKDPHQMPEVRTPRIPHQKEEMRSLWVRSVSQDSTLFLAKQEREPNKTRLERTGEHVRRRSLQFSKNLYVA